MVEQAKEYLNQVKAADMMVDQQREYIFMLRLIATGIGGMSTAERVQSSGTGDKMLRQVEKITAAEDDLADLIDAAEKVRADVARHILLVEDPLLQCLLVSKYLNWRNNRTTIELASTIGYSIAQTKRLHLKALSALGVHLT